MFGHSDLRFFVRCDDGLTRVYAYDLKNTSIHTKVKPCCICLKESVMNMDTMGLCDSNTHQHHSGEERTTKGPTVYTIYSLHHLLYSSLQLLQFTPSTVYTAREEFSCLPLSNRPVETESVYFSRGVQIQSLVFRQIQAGQLNRK